MKLPAKKAKPVEKNLISEIAMDIGKAVVLHVETMYPKAIEVTPGTFKLSLRTAYITRSWRLSRSVTRVRSGCDWKSARSGVGNIAQFGKRTGKCHEKRNRNTDFRRVVLAWRDDLSGAPRCRCAINCR